MNQENHLESCELSLSCRSKDGLYSLTGFTRDSSLEELVFGLSSQMDIDSHKMKILIGYPPKPIDMSDKKKKLRDIPLRSGEILTIVEEKCKSDGNDLPYYSSCAHPLVADTAAAAVAASNSPVGTVESASHAQVHEPIKVGIVPEGVLWQYIMPSNNSCLFESITFAASDGKQNPSSNISYLRQIIAEAVAGDTFTYNEAFLGQPNDEYCRWILQEEHWGGAIEISILCKHFGFEIVAVDLQSARLHHFGENCNFDHRIFLIYNGVHYDVLVLRPTDPDSPLQTVFPVTDENVLKIAEEIASNPFQQFSLLQGNRFLCTECNQQVNSQAEVGAHFVKTKHRHFTET